MTPEQSKANDELHAAVDNMMRVMGYNTGSMVTTDWLVCVAQHGFDDDGDGLTGIAYLVKDHDLSWHRLIGLVECVRHRLAVNFNRDGEED